MSGNTRECVCVCVRVCVHVGTYAGVKPGHMMKSLLQVTTPMIGVDEKNGSIT